MRHRSLEKYIVVFVAAATLPATLFGQSGGPQHSYRITPPLRVASRPVDGVAPRGVQQTDPFKPREQKDRPTALAIQGYCLVSLRDQQQWVRGSKGIQVLLGGKIYLFSSIRAREIFLAAPHLYLPALDGDCMVTFAETGNRQPGQLEYGLKHGSRLYFFTDQKQMDKFQSAPDEYLNVDLVDDGACVVTKVIEKRFAPGLPDTVAMVDGRRYFFASALQRRIFAQNPAPFLAQPLKNPFAAASLEVPDMADSLAIDALAFGRRPTAIVDNSALAPIAGQRAPDKTKSGKADDEASDHEDFMQGRAMSGYCPVTIRTQNTWRRGKAKFRQTFDGKVYFLAGSEEQAAFRANPALYAPVLGGDSVVTLATKYERAAGSVFHAFIYKERLYLFASEEERSTFRANPAQFENADLAAQGYCMVSRVGDKQEIMGAAEFETLYRGKRYRFASADYLQKFLADPKPYVEE